MNSTPPITIEAFEAGTFDLETFDHEAHVYLAWLYLGRYDVMESIRRYATNLKIITARAGVPGKYHETITWFFLLLVKERMSDAEGASWAGFRAANPDLFGPMASLLATYYPQDITTCQKARSEFLLPRPYDRSAGELQ